MELLAAVLSDNDHKGSVKWDGGRWRALRRAAMDGKWLRAALFASINSIPIHRPSQPIHVCVCSVRPLYRIAIKSNESHTH
jgi:hypothetical protein